MKVQALRKFWSLDADERASQIRAFGAVVCARAALATLPFSTASRLFDRSPSQVIYGAAAESAGTRIAREVRRASARVPGANCLVQALAARALLAREGIDSTMRIGVLRQKRGTIQAHAWVERDGRILVGARADTFTPLLP